MSTDTMSRTADFPAATGVRRRVGTKLLALAIGLALGAAVLWQGWSWWTIGRFTVSTDDAYVGGEVTAVAPRIQGFVAAVAVTDNQRVAAGDLLVRLDDRDQRAQLARTEAGIAAQQATLANLDANRRLQQAEIGQAEADLAATAAETARAKDDLDRYRSLVHDQYASTQRFQQADADYKKALAADRKAHAALDAATRRLDVIDTQKGQTQAALDQAKAERDLAQLALGYTEIRAPLDGVVGNRGVRVGAYVTAGTQLLSLVPARGLWVDANFKESQIGRLLPGQPVTITADVLPGEEIHGRVASLAPATGAQFSVIPPENATGNFTKIVQRVPVRILLDGAAADLGRLRPGLSVTVAIDERPGEAVREARR